LFPNKYSVLSKHPLMNPVKKNPATGWNIVFTLAAAASLPAHAAEPKPTTLPPVEVIGTTPLPGLSLARDLIPAPVQSATGADIQRSNAVNLPDFLNRNLGSVHINDMAGNAFQPDVNYRGYVASPVLGTPQGLSVYLDGVRLNQPFGDVVSWDLIPKSAIASINLMPGSNPLFGLNTLGGALSIQTKDGRSHPGAAMQVYGGQYARRAAEFDYGGSNQSLDWFVTGNLFRERGWRDESPSRIGQIFGKVSWRNATTDVKLTLSHADNRLQGSALQEERLLKLDYNSLYTKPDITDNKSTFVNLALNHSVNDNVVFSGNLYYRKMLNTTLHADISETSLDQALYQPNAAERAALTAAGYRGFPTAGATAANTPFPFWRCIANVLLNDEPGEKCNALINRARTSQNNYGFSGQFSLLGTLAGHKHQFTGGAAYDASTVRFGQTTQIGYLNADRSVTGLNAFADGITGGNINGEPFDNRVELSGRTHTWSIYATDTVSFNPALHLTLSGRYNRTKLTNSDLLNPGGGAGSLDGNHTFSRFNPAAGVSFTPSKAFKAYLGYSEGSRAPSAIELGCADPANPCRLPNSLAGDPPLNQVVTKTWEAGLHGTLPNNVKWNAGLFRAENNDDILFVAAPANTQFGYFKNFGKTRREGLELGASGKTGAFNLGANYTWLNATYQSAETVNAVGNSSNDTALAGEKGLDGNIRIMPGNRIPLVPRHLFKAYADYNFGGGFSAGLNLIAMGSSFARGNDNNLHTPDGVNYLGSGRSGGYTVFNLNAAYQLDKQLRFFAQINNLFNREYNNAAQLGPNGFTANGNFIARPFPATASGAFPVQQSAFYAPGAPRTAWIGLRYQFDAPAAQR
jgi:outer membrane receptor protein involved in Fe transport